MVTVLDRLVLYFIFTLGLIAVLIWAISIIQMSKILEQSTTNQEEHIKSSLEQRNHIIETKEKAKLSVEIAKAKQNAIDNIMNNISEINQKLNLSK